MTIGERIKELRIKNNLTQKDLADQLHVTFQTVSKWENNTNEPDLATIKELSKILNCSINDLFSDSDKKEEAKEDEPAKQEEVSPIPAPTPTVIIKKELHVCNRCHKDIEEGDLAIDTVAVRTRHARHHITTYNNVYYHKQCLLAVKNERAKQEALKRKAKTAKGKKWSFGWGIFAGVVGLGIALGVFFGVAQFQELHVALKILFSVLVGYGLFADLYCIISGSYIGEVFVSVSSWSIKFPGLIFSWDIDGIKWFIAMKILFAIIGFFIGLFALCFAIALTMFLSIISFPFVLVHNINNDYDDALVN